MRIQEAIRIAELWQAGKMVGADEGEVRDALLREVQTLRKRSALAEKPSSGAVFEAGTFVTCTFSTDGKGRGEVSFDVNTNGPYDLYAHPQSVYGPEIRALALFLLQCCEACHE